jgi:hypothetical protein
MKLVIESVIVNVCNSNVAVAAAGAASGEDHNAAAITG